MHIPRARWTVQRRTHQEMKEVQVWSAHFLGAVDPKEGKGGHGMAWKRKGRVDKVDVQRGKGMRARRRRKKTEE